ncbi:single-stranded DNA-specific exonuclease RecJ [Streptomyces lydicamycinicus]|uniref:Single-stranded DNA-specific exonuclease RecJ n=1 Tax=Streptomyces lydicamycinicus TaxID=1546107 RepID=A0A0P4R1K6_9ACTN|nr:single-stranded DNA-specific exonuclease RecJ [Streptomyces lydicamycinicus]
MLPGGSVSAVPEQPASSRAPASAAAGSADRAAGPVRLIGVIAGRREAEGRGARGGRIGFDIVQSSLFGAKALPGVRSGSSMERAKALPSG